MLLDRSPTAIQANLPHPTWFSSSSLSSLHESQSNDPTRLNSWTRSEKDRVPDVEGETSTVGPFVPLLNVDIVILDNVNVMGAFRCLRRASVHESHIASRTCRHRKAIRSLFGAPAQTHKIYITTHTPTLDDGQRGSTHSRECLMRFDGVYCAQLYSMTFKSD